MFKREINFNIYLIFCKHILYFKLLGGNVMLVKEIKKVKSLEKEVANIISNEEVSKSSKIKDLFLLGLTIKDISKKLDIRYQFVYNVVTNFVNTAGIEVVTEERTSKKGTIIELYLQGRTNKEISIELKVNYNYVFKVLKDYKLSLQESKVD